MARVKLSVACGLGLALGAAGLSAQTGQGYAYFVGPGTQGAFLNGAPLLPGTAILPGETVTTGAGGVVVLTPTQGAGGVIELTGNAAATLDPTGGQLHIGGGDALVMGDVSVVTPQGQVFTPQNGSRFVVNVANHQSEVGVLTGSVSAYTPGSPQPTVVGAGNAVQVSDGGGQVQLNRIQLSQLTRPDPNAALPKTIPASQSQ